MPKLGEWSGVLAAVAALPYIYSGLVCADPDGHTHGLPVVATTVDSRQLVAPPLPRPRPPVPRARVLGPADPPGQLLSLPWELVAVRHGGRGLVVYYVTGDAQPHGIYNVGFRVIASSQSVEILAVSRTEYHGGEQPASLGTGLARIVLSAPLGSRTLLHGPTDWPAAALGG